MAALFFDSSALVKRYVQETGSARVGGLCQSEADNTLYVVEITIVESGLISSATLPAQRHGLRAYDAVQLAPALQLQAERDDVGLSRLTFLSADNDLNAAAAAEGLTVDNPNNHL